MSDLLPGDPSPLTELRDERLAGGGVAVWLKRDDLIHPLLPGNKWRKLVPNLDTARAQGHHTLLTFGGAWSNHIRAVAAAGSLLGMSTIGVIRGEEHLPLNPVLAEATRRGIRETEPGTRHVSYSFFEHHAIELEPTYVSKMMYGLFDMIHNNEFRAGTRIVAVVTG